MKDACYVREEHKRRIIYKTGNLKNDHRPIFRNRRRTVIRFETQKHLKSIGFFLGTHDAVAVKVLHTPSHRCIESCARCPNLKKNDWRHRSLSTSARTLGRPNTVAAVVCNFDEKRSPPSFNPTLRSRQNTVTVDLGSIRTRQKALASSSLFRSFCAHYFDFGRFRHPCWN